MHIPKRDRIHNLIFKIKRRREIPRANGQTTRTQSGLRSAEPPEWTLDAARDHDENPNRTENAIPTESQQNLR